jgi:DNA-binding response OmpR family regulator
MSRTILLVDDDEAIRFSFAALLEDEGFQVHEAATLVDARAVLADHDVGLVLVDLNLEEGLGTELLPDARACASRPCFIVVSGDADARNLPGIDGALQKGDDPRQALEQIKAWLPLSEPR